GQSAFFDDLNRTVDVRLIITRFGMMGHQLDSHNVVHILFLPDKYASDCQFYDNIAVNAFKVNALITIIFTRSVHMNFKGMKWLNFTLTIIALFAIYIF